MDFPNPSTLKYYPNFSMLVESWRNYELSLHQFLGESTARVNTFFIFHNFVSLIWSIPEYINYYVYTYIKKGLKFVYIHKSWYTRGARLPDWSIPEYINYVHTYIKKGLKFVYIHKSWYTRGARLPDYVYINFHT